MMRQQSQQGFTLVEMIMVIVITGIIGGMVAVFLKAPIQQYMDVARRADMTDIADTALRRIGRDLRLALPNSVRVQTGVACPVTTANPGGTGTCSFLEFLPTSGGGRYRADTGGGAGCPASPGGEALFRFCYRRSGSSLQLGHFRRECLYGDQYCGYQCCR
jgi:prepilin-type N-terminal cleavage/methylation domain-containing protein